MRGLKVEKQGIPVVKLGVDNGGGSYGVAHELDGAEVTNCIKQERGKLEMWLETEIR